MTGVYLHPIRRTVPIMPDLVVRREKWWEALQTRLVTSTLAHIVAAQVASLRDGW